MHMDPTSNTSSNVSGAAVNIIDQGLVEDLHIPTIPCTPPLRVTAIDNQQIGEGFLYLHTLPLTLQINKSSRFPQEYEDLREVCSKEKASRLPPHRPWDCAIDLLPNAMPPKCRVYPLSLPESQAMEEYIEEALASGFIRPLTFPTTAGVFFVEKKDGGLRPSTPILYPWCRWLWNNYGELESFPPGFKERVQSDPNSKER
ncbi:hypothetical protein QTP86_004493 [Hemibagrus guttatus]|nr:hypothetical protein QTP86_004493 [Hemibagrus guttatus]